MKSVERSLWISGCAAVALASCGDNGAPAAPTSYLEPTAQRAGDATAGLQYLMYGDYVSSGVPLAAYIATQGVSSQDLGRTGDSAGVNYDYNVIEKNGVMMAVPQ
ncbi:MAG TPA: hypothetical protein PLF40_29845, partial [Kofleriaceae bacterium]|nr:hypothetical protein [Kofleriaceae bacterium]